MTDVNLFQTLDGGEMTVEGGIAEMTDGPFAAMYLALFGGNDDDPGLPGDRSLEWWANKNQTDPALQYRSRTQYVLRAMPQSPANIKRLEAAVAHDLQFLLDAEIMSSLVITISVPRLNWVSIGVQTESDKFIFDTAWEAIA